MPDLLALLPDDLRSLPPPIEPLPPSGLVPLVPSFESVPRDVMDIDGTIYRIFAEPGRPTHAAEFKGEISFGVLLGRPAAGAPLRVRELLTPPALAAFLQQVGAPPAHEAWSLDEGEHELILGPRILEVPCADVKRPIILLPETSYHEGRIDRGSSVRCLRRIVTEVCAAPSDVSHPAGALGHTPYPS